MVAYLLDLLRLPIGVRRFLMTEALYGIGIGMYTLVLNLHLLASGLREDEIGTLASVGILVMGASAIPIAMSARRFGRKRLLTAGIGMIATGCALYAFGGSLASFYLAQAFVSIGLTLVETTEVQLLFHYCASRKEETRAYSLMFAVFTAFAGAGTLAAGRMSGIGGGEGANYRIPLLIAAGLLIVLCIARGTWLPAERRSPASSDAGRTWQGVPRWKDMKPGRSAWVLSLFVALLGGAFALSGSLLNVLVKFRMDWTDDRVSLLLAANGFVLFVSSLLTPYIVERFGSHAAIMSVFGVNVILFSILYCQVPAWLFIPLFLMRGGGSTMLSNMVDSRLMSAFSDRERDLFAGMRSILRSIGSSGATFAAGWILAGRDYRLPFLLTAVALLLAWGYYVRWVRPIVNGA
ncbi:MFS transporter [Cohnella soli]|uniref:MFS transporter n=1 Tax=Cohnella soli TaxID=425005 RepID=A0ABW0I5R8_9BACL